MDQTAAHDAPIVPRCAVCGRPIRPGRRAGSWSHRPGPFASCDMDAEHAARPATGPQGPHPAGGPPGSGGRG